MTAECHFDDSVLSSFALFLKRDDKNIQGHWYKRNFTGYFVWVWNLVSNMKGREWQLIVLENRLRVGGIVWFKGKEVTGNWRKLRNDGLQNTMVISRTMNLSRVYSMHTDSGFGGLEVACWPLVPKFAGSQPAEAFGSLGRKNPQHAFLRRGSKAVGPMS